MYKRRRKRWGKCPKGEWQSRYTRTILLGHTHSISRPQRAFAHHRFNKSSLPMAAPSTLTMHTNHSRPPYAIRTRHSVRIHAQSCRHHRNFVVKNLGSPEMPRKYPKSIHHPHTNTYKEGPMKKNNKTQPSGKKRYWCGAICSSRTVKL